MAEEQPPASSEHIIPSSIGETKPPTHDGDGSSLPPTSLPEPPRHEITPALNHPTGGINSPALPPATELPATPEAPSPLRHLLAYLTFGLYPLPASSRAQVNAQSQAQSKPSSSEPKDVYREVAETVVFVVVLVLLLKTFIAEAFVIPTGSMATTLWGYQKYVECPNCGFPFPVNCSTESDPQSERPRAVTSCECPNCRFHIEFTKDVEGRLVEVIGGQLIIEDDPPVLDEIGRPRRYDIPFDPATVVVSVDGARSALTNLQPGMKIRVLFQQGGDRHAIAIDAATRGAIVASLPAFNPPPHSGDRVLVFKALYDTGLRAPQRQDVVVFKFPVEPQVNHTPMNYIKRLVGLSGETVAICQGNLYVYDKPRNIPAPEAYWARSKLDQYPWPDETDPTVKEARALWDKGEFRIVRKAPDVSLAMSRIVFDNDYQPEDTAKFPVRWTGDGWKKNDGRPKVFTIAGDGTAETWLRYHNILKAEGKAELISDFMGYNSSESFAGGSNWVGDLMLDTEVQIDKAEGEFVLELSRGVDRFQARFNIQSGECTLVRLSWDDPTQAGRAAPKTTELAKKPTAMSKPGKYKLRLANFDEQLTLWVNDTLPFGNGVEYPAAPPGKAGPTRNDLEPASVASKGAAVTVSHLRLSRDTYYTSRVTGNEGIPGNAWSDPSQWNTDELRRPTPKIMYVYPGHYLCMGDNSPASADSRSWGMVPDRLMLGRALVVYFPFYFPYWPINSPTNRVGAIR
jgi:signal peptidase I